MEQNSEDNELVGGLKVLGIICLLSIPYITMKMIVELKLPHWLFLLFFVGILIYMLYWYARN